VNGFRLTVVEIGYLPRAHGKGGGSSFTSILRTVRDMGTFWILRRREKMSFRAQSARNLRRRDPSPSAQDDTPSARGQTSAILILIALNMVAHFLPLERAALAPDDYAFLVRVQDHPISQIINVPDRPLNYLVLYLQAKLAGDSPSIGFLLVVFSSTFLLLGIFYLMRALLKDDRWALLCAMIYMLLPNKLETYHTPIFFNMNMAIALYIWSFVFFMRRAVLASCILYGIALFWYEVGFFLPCLLALYQFLYSRPGDKNLPQLFWFFLIALIYVLFRQTGGFGWAGSETPSHRIDLSIIPFNLLELVHHYVGRYMARSILYGIAVFFKMPPVMLMIHGIAIALSMVFVSRMTKRLEQPKVDTKILMMGLGSFSLLVLPIHLNHYGGVGGRHLALPSVGVAIGVLGLIPFTRRHWKKVLHLFIVFLFVIAQGNGWAQVIACRLNASVYQALKENRLKINQSRTVVFDMKSFSDRIPHTWIKRDFNVLTTYYGAQAFEDWGLISMVKLVSQRPYPSIYVAATPVAMTDEGQWQFGVLSQTGYRKVTHKIVKIPQKESTLINYDTVYGGHFRDGKNVIPNAKREESLVFKNYPLLNLYFTIYCQFDRLPARCLSAQKRKIFLKKLSDAS
ncbi:MAG: hypothetical protein AAB309_00655, partial [Deltaproteobacteria bacterium]